MKAADLLLKQLAEQLQELRDREHQIRCAACVLDMLSDPDFEITAVNFRRRSERFDDRDARLPIKDSTALRAVLRNQAEAVLSKEGL